MKIHYTVHSVGEEMGQVEVDIGGTKVMATVPELIVELVSDEPTQKNHMLRIPTNEVEDARKKFVEGASVVGTFTIGKGPAK